MIRWWWWSRIALSMALIRLVKNHRPMNGVIAPTSRVRPEARPDAVGLAM